MFNLMTKKCLIFHAWGYLSPGCLWLCVFYFLFSQLSFAATELTANGDAFVLKKGEQAVATTPLKSPMLLLITNVSGELAGTEVSYSVVSATGQSIRTLPQGNPSPQIWINNWQGQAFTITNLSLPSNAKMQLNLYGIASMADDALKNDFSLQALAQYKSVGGEITANDAYLVVRAPFEESNFVIMIGTDLYKYTVNGAREFNNQSDIRETKNNTLAFSIRNQLGKRILIVNASRTATARASVSYRLLTDQ